MEHAWLVGGQGRRRPAWPGAPPVTNSSIGGVARFDYSLKPTLLLPTLSMSTLVYISRNFTEFGAFTTAEIVDFKARGVVLDSDFLREDGSGTWVPVADFLAALPAPTPAPAPAKAPAKKAAKAAKEAKPAKVAKKAAKKAAAPPAD